MKPQRKKNNDAISKKQITGHSYRLGSNPPPVTKRPKYPLTILIASGSSTTITVSQVLGQLYTQLGLPPNTAPTNLFLQRVELWTTTLGDNSISCIVHDPLGSGTLAYLEDTGNSAHTAGVGYSYPLAVQSRPLDDGTSDLLTVTSSTPAQIYFRVMWSSAK